MNQQSKTAYTPVLRAARFVWRHLPKQWVATAPMRRLGHFIYDRYVRDTDRSQTHMTRFLRNVPQLEVLRARLGAYERGATLRIASIGCSSGAELYSLLWVARNARPDLHIVAVGVDVSARVLDVARAGVYQIAATAADYDLDDCGRVAAPVSEFLTFSNLFEPLPSRSLRVQDWLREGVDWIVGDASDARLVDRLGPQDLVLACNFLGPMPEAMAEACLRNVIRMVAPNGLLVLDGMDLDLKARLMPTFGLVPILDRIEAVHSADPSKHDWPWKRWSHEPFDRCRPDWSIRYSTLFARAEAPAEVTVRP